MPDASIVRIFVDGSVGEQPLELLAHRVEQIDVQTGG